MTDPSTIAKRAAERKYPGIKINQDKPDAKYHEILPKSDACRRKGHEARSMDLLPLMEESRKYMRHAKDCKEWGLDRTKPYPHPIIELCTCGLTDHLSKLNEILNP